MKTKRPKNIDSPLFVPLTLALYVVGAGVLVGGMALQPREQMEVALTAWVPSFLWFNFLFLVGGGIWCREELAAAWRGLFADPNPPCPASLPVREGRAFSLRLRQPGWCLSAIVFAGLALAVLAAPQGHRLFFDEDIYANMGQNMALTGRLGMANWGTFEYGEYFVNWLLYNKDPGGWPFLMSLVFQLLGTDETHGFYLNNLLFAGGIVVAFSIGLVGTARPRAALWGAFLYALIPHNIIWANTLAAETSASLLEGLVVLLAFLWLRDGQRRHLFLLAASSAFTLAMRPEAGLILLWIVAATALNPFGRRPHPLATGDFWAGGAVFLTLAVPHLWHLYAMGGQSWGAPGPKFSLAFFLGNVAVNGPYYVNNGEFPVVATLLSLGGAAAGLFSSRRRVALLFLLWFLLFWGVFLFFYAGSYKYGADVRFSLLSFMPLSVLGGWGADLLLRWAVNGGAARPAACPYPQVAAQGRRRTATAILVAFFLLSWLKFMPLVRLVGQEGWGARADHAFAREFLAKVPSRSIVLSHVPAMFLLWGHSAIQAYAGINNPDVMEELLRRYRGEVYFHWGYWCNAADDENRLICERIGRLYHLEPVAQARQQDNLYGLYRLTPR